AANRLRASPMETRWPAPRALATVGDRRHAPVTSLLPDGGERTDRTQFGHRRASPGGRPVAGLRRGCPASAPLSPPESRSRRYRASAGVVARRSDLGLGLGVQADLIIRWKVTN